MAATAHGDGVYVLDKNGRPLGTGILSLDSRAGDIVAGWTNGDVAERAHWDAYMEAYEETIRHTATPEAPWYVIPADNKWFTRLVVAAVVIEALASLRLAYPTVSPAQLKKLALARRELTRRK